MSSKSSGKGIQLLKTRRGQIIFCCAGLALSGIFLLMQFGLNFGSMMPTAAGRKKLEDDLKKLEKEKQELQADLNAQQAVRDMAAAKFNGAWQVREHGRPEVQLRTALQEAAKKFELTLNSLSSVRKSNFNREITLLEIDVNATSDLDTLTKFWLEINKITPQLYWKRFECRMSYMYGMPAVAFTGTLRCVCDERPDINRKKHPSNKENGGSK